MFERRSIPRYLGFKLLKANKAYYPCDFYTQQTLDKTLSLVEVKIVEPDKSEIIVVFNLVNGSWQLIEGKLPPDLEDVMIAQIQQYT